MRSIAVTPFLRYYLKSPVFVQVFAGTSNGSVERISNQMSSSNDAKSTIWGIGVGYAYFINNGVAIEPLLNSHL
jgi:hypothetical protein